MTPEILRLYTSPGHNFVGHHDQEPGEHPMLENAEIHCIAGHGIEGDRFYDFKEDYNGQVTFFDWDVYEAVRTHFRLPDLAPSAFRRNILVRNLDLPALVGKTFELQGLQFEGTEESRPCRWMSLAVAEGAKDFLKNRGGLRARIVTSGTLRVPAARG